ncbi:MAG TPA: MFS transporter [Chitinophagaceae bacterium]|nr:MFS transporter [Chitinophagaceae bacterium]
MRRTKAVLTFIIALHLFKKDYACTFASLVLKSMSGHKEKSIYSLKFWLLCFSSFLFSSSFNMLIPELPAYLSSMGGAEYKGYIIGLFTITAGLSRPFSGRLTDTVGRVPVMIIGSLVCVLCSLLYPLLTTISGFLLLRLFHGFSTGFKPTATAAYIADVIPMNRWGEAMGIHGLCFSTGLAIGPALGSLITSYYSINWLFYCSSFFALLSIIILINLKETHSTKQRFTFSLLKIKGKDIFEPLVLPVAIVTFFGYLSYGAILTLIPDWGAHLGVENKGTFYVLFTLASLVVRFIAGRLSDRKGRVYVLRIGLGLIVLAVFILGLANSVPTLFTGAVIYGMGTGLFSPAISAWTADLSPVEYRGRGMATMYISLEAGIGIGAFIAGWLFRDQLDSVPYIFYGAAFITILALIYLLVIYKPVTVAEPNPL